MGLFRLLPLAVVASAIGAAGCEGCSCGRGAYVGQLVTATAPVERDFSDRRDEWSAAAEGDHFRIGDGLRTKGGGAALIELARGGRLRLGENSFIRFLAEAPDSEQPRLELGGGGAEVSGGEVGVELQTPGGRLVVNETSEVSVELGGDDEELRFEVTLGQVRFIDRQERPHEVRTGEQVVVNLETGAVFRARRGPPPDPEEPDASAPAEEPDAGGDPGPLQVEVSGSGAELRGPEESRWAHLDEGPSQVRNLAAVRLSRRSSIEVRRAGGQVTLAGRGRATLGGAPGTLLSLSGGRADARAGSLPVTVGLPGGVAIMRPRGGADVRIRRHGVAEVTALQGQIEVRGDEESHVLELGERARITSEGEVEIFRSPSRSHIAFTAGGGGTVHDPRPPTHVAIRFGDACPSAGVVRIAGSEDAAPILSKGVGSAVLRLGKGPYRYSVHCIMGDAVTESTAAEGSLRIIADPGTTPMATTPAHNTVDADGRGYSVMYQNVLPQITFRWSDAPEAASYTLHVAGPGGRAFTKSGSRARHSFRGGTLSEGSYRYHFTAAGGRRSPESTLRVRFDTAVATASITEPVNGTISAGQTVRVSGLALRGSTVEVGDLAIPFDGPFRFGGSAAVPTDQDALVIRVTHPRGGVHYFLRRLSGGSE